MLSDFRDINVEPFGRLAVMLYERFGRGHERREVSVMRGLEEIGFVLRGSNFFICFGSALLFFKAKLLGQITLTRLFRELGFTGSACPLFFRKPCLLRQTCFFDAPLLISATGLFRLLCLLGQSG